ncbi:ATP-dependent DNA helicase RecG [Clostridium oryzae]|uniref:ATP-dependent DNA helicase RecG n=1 Tax=Clostridium oryzae TaxID=1450648 RepID=A0A1V4IPC2_9CLOT|nr:ATP-dependent DNA helicase RecG [Clostridium oryzae]OPJ61766.1 ATP-dependent DNA helicase RecG [Clostridium oryzae]
MNLNNEIDYIKGVGPKLKKALNGLGIITVKDLLLYFPRDYDQVNDIGTEGMSVICGTVEHIEADIITNTGKRLTKILFNTEKSAIHAQWFNQPYIKNSFVIGKQYRLYGKISEYKGNKIMVNGKIIANNKDIPPFVPKYAVNNAVKSSSIEKIVKTLLEQIEINENMPIHILEKYSLCSLDFAVRNIHFPINRENLMQAIKRLKFQELFVYSLKLQLIKKENRIKQGDGIMFKISSELVKLKEALPFKLTEAQNRVIREILVDEKSQKTMNRLLQGDVGSGKTIVAFIAIFNVIKNGYQACLMVPTEVLANQHFSEAKKLFEKFNINIALLVGSMTNKQKKQVKEQLKSGEIHLAIGTHALIQDDIEFYKLGMVVTDEQHRFGVYQRAQLLNKGENVEVLVMSATPIPRTLSLFLYGDLDLSIIDELPPGRKQIDTMVVEINKSAWVYNMMVDEVKKGRQGYIVCPLIEENEQLDLNSLQTLYKQLKKSFFKDISVEMMHGKLSPKDKEEIMEKYKNGEIKILISTTVIEVGINVPNASVMVIENAERFGLSQLHQLRGRIGRGEYKSYCILLANIKSEITKKRLEVIKNSSDGFKIAEEDMKIRGAGDVFGFNQHGDNALILSNIYQDMSILKAANYEARNLINEEDKYSNIIKELSEEINNSSKYICFN